MSVDIREATSKEIQKNIQVVKRMTKGMSFDENIDKTYDMNLRNKMESFRKATNCKKSIQLVMVTTYGVKPGKYSGVVNAEVTLDDLFR